MFLIPQLEVRETGEKGKGVFSTGIIPPGSVIGDYLGTVMPADAGDSYENDAVYDMWYSDKVDICPDPESEGAHLLNSSCEPNCAMSAIGRHTVLFALRKIFPGEELTYDYFLGEQEEDDEPGSDNCVCGSPLCRGTMYSNPQHYEAWDKYITKLIGNEPEYPPVKFGEKLPPLGAYPKSIEDNPIYNIFGYRGAPPKKCQTGIFASPDKLRAEIRETGKMLLFEELNVIVEGMMFERHTIIKHMAGIPEKRKCSVTNAPNAFCT